MMRVQCLLFLTASACVLAKGLPCDDGSCVPSQEYIKINADLPQTRDTSLELPEKRRFTQENADLPLTRDTSLELPEERRFTQERWDAVLEALNNDAPEQIVGWPDPIFHSTLKTEYEFSSGNQVSMTQFQQLNNGEMNGNNEEYMTMLITITVGTNEEGYDYDLAKVVNIYTETMYEETLTPFLQVGNGKSFVRSAGGEYENVGNVTLKGNGSLSQNLEGDTVLISEDTEIEETESLIKTMVIYLDTVISVKDDQEFFSGYEIITQEIRDKGQEASANEPISTMVGQIQEERPISGLDGSIKESFNGTASGVQESTVTAEGTGYQWYTKGSVVGNERISLLKQSLKRFSLFH